MGLRETSALLWLVVRGDQYPRGTSDSDIAYWHELVGDLDYDDAVDAVRWHRQNSTDYLQPAHIRRHALRLRGERKRREERVLSGPPTFSRPPEVQAYVEHQAERTREYLRGMGALPPAPAPDSPADDQAEEATL